MQHSDQQLLEEFMDEDEPWLLVGNPNKDIFLVPQYLARNSGSAYQHMKELMSVREGLHEVMQCYMRQHFADRNWLHEHPGRHSS